MSDTQTKLDEIYNESRPSYLPDYASVTNNLAGLTDYQRRLMEFQVKKNLAAMDEYNKTVAAKDAAIKKVKSGDDWANSDPFISKFFGVYDYDYDLHQGRFRPARSALEGIGKGILNGLRLGLGAFTGEDLYNKANQAIYEDRSALDSERKRLYESASSGDFADVDLPYVDKAALRSLETAYNTGLKTDAKIDEIDARAAHTLEANAQKHEHKTQELEQKGQNAINAINAKAAAGGYNKKGSSQFTNSDFKSASSKIQKAFAFFESGKSYEFSKALVDLKAVFDRPGFYESYKNSDYSKDLPVFDSLRSLYQYLTAPDASDRSFAFPEGTRFSTLPGKTPLYPVGLRPGEPIGSNARFNEGNDALFAGLRLDPKVIYKTIKPLSDYLYENYDSSYYDTPAAGYDEGFAERLRDDIVSALAYNMAQIIVKDAQGRQAFNNPFDSYERKSTSDPILDTAQRTNSYLSAFKLYLNIAYKAYEYSLARQKEDEAARVYQSAPVHTAAPSTSSSPVASSAYSTNNVIYK